MRVGVEMGGAGVVVFLDRGMWVLCVRGVLEETVVRQTHGTLRHQRIRGHTMSALPSAVRWLEICVQDMPRAKAFYERVFGRTCQQLSSGGPGQPEIWAFSGSPDGSGALGALVKMDGVDSGGNSVIV